MIQLALIFWIQLAEKLEGQNEELRQLQSVMWFMQTQNNGANYDRVCRMRPKQYSYLTDDSDVNKETNDTKKCHITKT